MSSPDEQAALRAALDAALDELGDDDSDDDDDEGDLPTATIGVLGDSRQHPGQGSDSPQTSPREKVEPAPTSLENSAEKPGGQSEQAPSNPAPFMGPERPPQLTTTTKKKRTTDPDKLFMEMMEDMLFTPQEGVSGPDEMMMRLVEKMQEQLHEMEEEELEDEGAGGGDVGETVPEAAEPPAAATALPEASTAPDARSSPQRDDGAREPPTTESSATTPPASNESTKKSKATRQPHAAPSDTEQNVDKAISNLIEGMAKQASLDATEGLEDVNESELLNMLMKGMGTAGAGEGEFDADAMIDGMMEQLLCKDLMYEPMKQVAVRFPKWLEERRNVLSEKELGDRERQCQCFQKLVHAYETKPDDIQHLMALMQEVQEFGQPPSEIIHEIAPGLELDSNGLPKLEGSGLPFAGSEECRVM